MLEPRQVERIAERLDARFGLDALWVFGSVARGTATAASAVDVAALFGRRPAPLDLLDARRRPRCSPGCAVVDRDVVTAKIATIDRCLERIAFTRTERRSLLLPVEVEDIVVLNRQRAVQAAIDLATHIVTAEEYGLPEVVEAIVTRHLGDLREFSARILARYGL